MNRGSMAVLLVLLGAFVLAGCGGFRQQAEEAQTRISSVRRKRGRKRFSEAPRGLHGFLNSGTYDRKCV